MNIHSYIYIYKYTLLYISFQSFHFIRSLQLQNAGDADGDGIPDQEEESAVNKKILGELAELRNELKDLKKRLPK